MRTLILAAALLLAALPSEGAWRVTGAEFTVYYCGPAARMQRVDDVLRWKLAEAPIVWRVTLESAIRTSIIPASANCGGARTEAKWTMQRVDGEFLIIPFLQQRGYDTSGMTAAQLADAFSVEFKAELLEWEGQYNEHLAAQQTPAADPVDPLEEP